MHLLKLHGLVYRYGAHCGALPATDEECTTLLSFSISYLTGGSYPVHRGATNPLSTPYIKLNYEKHLTVNY